MGTSAPSDDGAYVVATGNGGNTRWMRQIALSGTYTPAIVASSDTNVGATTFGTARFTRTGKVVTVSGAFSITPTAASSTLTILSVTLPLSATLSAGTLSGCAALDNTTTVYAGGVTADTSNHAAKFRFNAATTGAHTLTFSYTYSL